MTDNIYHIFQVNIRLITETDQVIYYFRKQQYEKALFILTDSIERIKYVSEAITMNYNYFNLENTEPIFEMLKGILEAQKNKDFILIADLLELQLLSLLCNVQELIVKKENIVLSDQRYAKNAETLYHKYPDLAEYLMEPLNPTSLLENGYRVEFTSSGLMTLAANNNGKTFYFHSNSRPDYEAFLLALEWYRKDITTYIIFGFGMGYHISQLDNISVNANIEIYETDMDVIRLACAFSDQMDLVLQDRIKLVYDPDGKKLKDRISSLNQGEGFYIHYPSFKNVRKPSIKELLEGYIPWSGRIEY